MRRQTGARAARGVRERAVCEPLRQRSIDSTAPLCSVPRALRADAVESVFCWRSGSHTARLRVPLVVVVL
eukprot:4476290-Lingulodinium_polyedra.AAC.1